MKILVATDGTKEGQAAVRMAAEIAAGRSGAEVEVVSVYEIPAMTPPGPYVGAPLWYPEMIEGEKARAAGAAEAACKNVSAACPEAVVDPFVSIGGPAEVILERAAEWKADLIVAGCHGYGFFGRSFYGSVSDDLAHHAPCSVLVVKDGKKA